jgi:outer membrane protein assembly factor BamB
MLERSDKNKDGKLTPDEYGTVNVLRAAGQYMGKGDGIVTEEKWNQWNAHVQGPSGLVALDLAKPSTPLWRYEKGFDSVIPSPLVYDGVVYSVRNGGILTAFDARSGEVTKSARIPGALGGYAASPVAGGGHLYFCNEEGKVAVLKPGREWELVQLNDLKEDIFATPALSQGTLYIRTSGALYAFR